MSYQEYSVRHIPTGPRKLLCLNWPVALMITADPHLRF